MLIPEWHHIQRTHVYVPFAGILSYPFFNVPDMVAVLVAVPFTFPVMGILVHRSPTHWAFIRRMDRVYSIVDFSYLMT